MSELKWLTTASTGFAHTHGADDGVTGWKLHLVKVDGERQYRSKYGYVTSITGTALCGLRAKYGWGLDLFIEDECARCVARAEKLNIEFPKDSK